MAKEYVELVDEIPTQSLRVLLEFVRGNYPGNEALALAAINIESYGLKTFLPKTEPTFSMSRTPAPGRQAVEQALLAAIPDENGVTKMQGPAVWLTILQFVGPLVLDWLKNR